MICREWVEKLAAGHGAVFRALGLEHLSPKTTHPRGWDSSEMIRGPLGPYSGYPLMDLFREVRCC